MGTPEKVFAAKRALITGAGRGIGAALAALLAERSCELLLCARSEDELQSTQNQIRRQWPQARVDYSILDVSSEASVLRLWDQLESSARLPQILVNNAGFIRVQDIEAVSLDDWTRTQNVNLLGCFLMSRELFRRLRQEASILNVSSLAGVLGVEKFKGFAAYSAAKAGVLGLTEALAVEGRDRMIRVNAVCPGATETRMLREALPEFKGAVDPRQVALIMLDVLEKSFTQNLSGHVEVLSNV